MRTHYCGQIDETLVEHKIELLGWVHRVRDLGGIIFIDLRDREGLVQIVIAPENTALTEIAKSLHNEYVIQVSGQVRLRPEGIVNLNLKTGKVEIVADKLEILNRAAPLPFPINEPQETSEELRLRYRYLDLRRENMTQNLILRAKITRIIRNFLDDEGFLEIETPILTKSTPEGARDYLVPSRVQRGSFYALPQSPQIFKQLLMASGFDRYYQIARCFRDEDLRADRQPEFTQLDLEMSFVTAQEIQVLMEDLIRHLFQEVLQIELPKPFPCLRYEEAMARFGSDKPDLRIPLELIEIKDLVKNTDFAVFSEPANSDEGRVVALKLPNSKDLSRKKLDDLTEFVKGLGLKGLAYLKVNDLVSGINGLQSSILKFLPEQTINSILQRVKAENNDLIFFGAGLAKNVNAAFGALRLKLGKEHNLIQENTWQPLWLIDFPLFEKQDGAWTPLHHPFTAPLDEDAEKLEKNPGKAHAKAYDLILNGEELGGGSIRIDNAVLQKTVFRILGISEETAQAQFGHLLEAFQYGYPSHGGIAFGLDRIVMLMAGAHSLREVIAFPKTNQAYCPLTKAPSEVSANQLHELGLSID